MKELRPRPTTDIGAHEEGFIDEVRAMYAQDLSIHEIANQLGCEPTPVIVALESAGDR